LKENFKNFQLSKKHKQQKLQKNSVFILSKQKQDHNNNLRRWRPPGRRMVVLVELPEDEVAGRRVNPDRTLQVALLTSGARPKADVAATASARRRKKERFSN
jgi:hypothetical protein